MTKYPGNEMDPAEWLRMGRRYVGVCVVLGIAFAIGAWLNSLHPDVQTQWAVMVGAFFGALFGFFFLAWTVFYVGRQIARILWGVMMILQEKESEREHLKAQGEELFGDATAVRGREHAHR